MASNLDVDYRSSTASLEPGAEDLGSVLLVDDDEATLEAVTAYAGRGCDSIAVWGTADAATAFEAVQSRPWDCLVVGRGLSGADRRELVTAAACPTVLFTEAGRRATDDPVVAAADVVLERGTDDRVLATLFQRVRGHALGGTDGGIDAFDRDRMRELLVEQARDGLYVFDADGVVAFCNEAFAAMLGYETEDLIGRHAAEFFAEGELKAALRDVQDVVDSPASGGDSLRTFVRRDGELVSVSVNFTVLPGDDGSFGGFVCVTRDVTDRRRREDELAAKRDDLARITRADAMVQDVVRELGRASTRKELERTVCERVVELDGVTMAWIGKREGANDRIVPGTVVGEPQQYLRDVVATTSVDDATGGPVLRAVETGDVQVVDDFREDERVEHWRELALSYDLASLAMIPLTHGATVHGVLAVYATRPGAFGDVLADRFGLLGDTVGFAVTAVQNKRLVERDATLELEFRSNSDGAYLVPLAAACGCRLEAVGSVAVGDDVLQYVEVDGAPVADVADAALECDDVATTRVVRETGPDAGVLERRTSASIRTALSDVGARLRTAVATESGARVVVDASRDGDVRTIHEAVCRYNPDATLVSKTDRTDPNSGDADGVSVDDALTDRQREVLRAAHLAGYYAWPRDSTAEELAESLDLASPTLHQHLRRAERNILAELFDE